MELVDWRGTPMIVGSIVVYPGRSGSHQWMMEGEIVDIVQEPEHPWSTDLITKLKVLPLRQGRYHRTNKKVVRLTVLERVTVVDNPNRMADVLP